MHNRRFVKCWKEIEVFSLSKKRQKGRVRSSSTQNAATEGNKGFSVYGIRHNTGWMQITLQQQR